MLTTLPLMGNVTAGAAIDEPVPSVAAPPKRSVVPAAPVNDPVLVPPPSRARVPPAAVMSTRPALFMAIANDEMPVPAVLRTVPLLTKVDVPPPLRLIVRSVWRSQVPVLVITQLWPLEQVWRSPVPVHVLVALVVKRRPALRTLVGPLRDKAALKIVSPAPVIVPPLQLDAAEAMTVPVPPRVPADWMSAPALAGAPLLKLTIPLLMVVWAAPYEPLTLVAPLEALNTTVAAATDDAAARDEPAPANRSVVPADPVKEPALVPPPSRLSVPPDTVMSTRLALFIAAPIDVTPAPAVLRTVPSLTNVVVPP